VSVDIVHLVGPDARVRHGLGEAVSEPGALWVRGRDVVCVARSLNLERR